MANISAPARRALISKNINSLNDLAQYSEKEILDLHGIGPTAIPKLKAALKDAGLSFRKI
jgi:DNA-directed RNA polymerase alpha subunit